jgi:hypothetical protein
LAPGEVRILHLADFTAKAQLPADAFWGTVVLQYQGRSGDLVPVATSFDSSGHYGLQTPFSSATAHLWKGSMWHVEPARDSLITAGNGGSEPTHAALTLFYNNGKRSYSIEKLLEPDEQIWADVGEIIRDQIPDKDGKRIPPNTMMGSYELRDLDHLDIGSLYEGKLVLDKTWGHGYYGCMDCCGSDGVWMDPNPMSGAISTGGWNEVDFWDCTDTEYDATNKAYNWRSLNTAVATLANAYTNWVGVGSTNGYSSIGLESNRRLCPVQTYNPGNTQNTVSLTCSPSTVSWGSSVNCTVSGASASQVTQWTFSAPGIAVNGPSGTTTWSDPMVASGTVKAVAMGVSLTQSVTVNRAVHLCQCHAPGTTAGREWW